MKHLIGIFVISMLLVSGNAGYGQVNQSLALKKGQSAVRLMDNGQVKEGMNLLRQAIKLDPEKFDYPYELAYAHYLLKDYKGCIKLLEKLKSHKDIVARLFQLLGNCYDNTGKPEKAIRVYEAGLVKFPDTGFLYNELGILNLRQSDAYKALSWFEKGIYKDPAFPSDYYWATRLYCISTEEMLGIIYGEIFMNLERNSIRTEEIGKLLFNTYKNQIHLPSDSAKSVHFSQNKIVRPDTLAGGESKPQPFGITVYEPILLLSVIDETVVDINSLDRIRSNFLKLYFQKEYNVRYPNVLFDYQEKIFTAGYMEAYNHWLLMKGDEAGFNTWYAENKDKWDAFVKWFTDNPLQIDLSDRFYGTQF